MTRAVLYAGLMLVLATIAWSHRQAIGAASPPSNLEEPRLTVFVSDLHLGIGKIDGTDQWHRTEDFRWAKELGLFLDFLDQAGQGKTDLIIVGDFLELWQSLDMECIGQGTGRRCQVKDCVYDNLDLGCTQTEALRRLQRILSEHANVFHDLSAFASAAKNRVMVIPGNHDAALIYPSLAQTVLDAIPAPEGRVRIAQHGYWRSADGRVMAEHGHQFDKVNRFDEWPWSFLKDGGQIYLRRPWGEQFVQAYYNEYEERFPIVDNISEEGEGVRLGIAAGGVEDTTKAVALFFDFFLFQVSWDQFRGFLGEEGNPPQWDVKRIKYDEGVRFLVESIPGDDPMRQAAQKAFEAGTLNTAPANLTDASLITLCDQRAAFATLLNKPGRAPLITECPREKGTLGAGSDYLFRTPDGILKEHLKQTYEALQRAHPETPRFETFVYGHTHKANAGFQPIKEHWNPTVVNTGAFQRVVTPGQLKQIQKKRGLKDEEVLLALQPEDLPACYSYIRINPKNWPTPLLRYWVQDKDGHWQEQDRCE